MRRWICAATAGGSARLRPTHVMGGVRAGAPSVERRIACECERVLTLWDLLPRRLRPRQTVPRQAPQPRATVARKQGSAEQRYAAMTKQLLAEHGIRVRRWRTGMSGVAWEMRGADGSTTRFIEAPRPKGPMSAAIFLHEVGHHAIGLGAYRPRCLEEYHAWEWAIRAMERFGITITESVLRRRHNSLAYALAKARRRGIASVPPELGQFSRSVSRRAEASR